MEARLEAKDLQKAGKVLGTGELPGKSTRFSICSKKSEISISHSNLYAASEETEKNEDEFI